MYERDDAFVVTMRADCKRARYERPSKHTEKLRKEYKVLSGDRWVIPPIIKEKIKTT